MENLTIIYIHGFASGSNASKGKLITQAFPNHKVLTPQLNSDPGEAIKDLNTLINTETRSGQLVILVGSSLGGFMADYFNMKYDMPAVLLNPLVDPMDMVQFEGENTNFTTGEIFNFTDDDIVDLVEIFDWKKKHQFSDSPEYILLSKDDEVIDYSIAEHYYQHSHQVVVAIDSGGHRLNGKDLEVVSIIESLIEDMGDHDWVDPFSETTFIVSSKKRLRERFINYIPNDASAHEDKIAMLPEIRPLIDAAYAKIGGFLGDDEELTADSTMWKLVRRSGRIVAGMIYKGQLGRKGFCGFTDGSAEGKEGLRMIVKEDDHLNRAWIEVSDAMERFYDRNTSGTPLPHELVKIILDELGKEVLDWDPDGYHYTRMIGGGPHTKVMYGSFDAPSK